jgi:Exonuclease
LAVSAAGARTRITHDCYRIVDMEATCSADGSVPPHKMEIIEIGAVMQSARTFEVESKFQSFVCPVRHPELTEFCTESGRRPKARDPREIAEAALRVVCLGESSGHAGESDRRRFVPEGRRTQRSIRAGNQARLRRLALDLGDRQTPQLRRGSWTAQQYRQNAPTTLRSQQPPIHSTTGERVGAHLHPIGVRHFRPRHAGFQIYAGGSFSHPWCSLRRSRPRQMECEAEGPFCCRRHGAAGEWNLSPARESLRPRRARPGRQCRGGKHRRNSSVAQQHQGPTRCTAGSRDAP